MPTLAGLLFTVPWLARETSTTTGTGTYSTNGAVSGFVTFLSEIGSGSRCSYCARSGSNFEFGLGTVTGGSLTRDYIDKSSNNNNPVNWPGGTIDIYACPPPSLFEQFIETALANVKVTEFTTSGTFTTDTNCVAALVEAVGAGGGAGSAQGGISGGALGGFGAGGEYRYRLLTAAQLGASKAVTIGAGGAGGLAAGSPNDGSSGGSTILAGGLLTAIGGGPGAGGANSTGNVFTAGGEGGDGGSGGFGHRGSGGGSTMVIGGVPIRTGVSGGSFLGGGTHIGALHVAGNTALTPGSGGAPAAVLQNASNFPGGAGAPGWMRFTEYLKV